MPVAAAANALATVADVKYAWGRVQTDTSHDDRIQTLINLISGRIEDWCGRGLKAATYTDEPYDGDEIPGEDLWLKQYPVISFSALKIDGVIIDAAAYLVYNERGLVKYPNGWGSGTGIFGAKQNVQATYTAGYATVPGGLGIVCIEWVIVLLESRVKDAETNNVAESMTPPAHLEAALAPYKRRDF